MDGPLTPRLDGQFTELMNDLVALNESAANVSSLLHLLGGQIEESGLLPSDDALDSLCAQVRDCRASLAQLTAQVRSAAAVMPSLNQVPEHLDALPTLASFIAALEAAYGEYRRNIAAQRVAAVAILNRIMALEHRVNPGFEPLLEIRKQASDLKMAIQNIEPPAQHAMVTDLAGGTHPFAELLMLVVERDGIDDERLESVHKSVSAAFGGLVAIAAMSGRFIESDAVPSHAALVTETSEEPPTTAAATTPDGKPDSLHTIVAIDESELVVPNLTYEGGVNTDLSDGQPELVVLSGDVTLRYSVAGDIISAELAQTVDEGVQVRDIMDESSLSASSPSMVDPNFPAESISKDIEPLDSTAVEAGDEHAPTHSTDAGSVQGTQNSLASERIDESVCHLLTTEEQMLAYHLARAAEQEEKYNEAGLPSQLLAALILGSHVQSDQGALASRLTEFYGGLGNAVSIGLEGEYRTACQFLAIAATLRPALLAPRTGAPQVLDEVCRSAISGGLYEYCQRIVKFGNALQPLNPSTLRTVSTQADWQERLRDLQQRVGDWMKHAQVRKLIYARATSVLREWLKQGAALDALLSPVRENKTELEGQVRNKIAELSAQDQVERLVTSTDSRLRHIHSNAIEAKALRQLHDVVKQATAYAAEWLALLDERSEQRDHRHREALDLQREINRLKAAALTELAVIDGDTDRLAQYAISLCRDAITWIDAMLNHDRRKDADEPEPRDLLNADLLRLPDLRLAADWEPRDSPSALVNGILVMASEGLPSWTEAFEMRGSRERRDHEGTEWIIEHLATTAFPVDLDELRQKRRSWVQECRNALRRDNDQTRQEIEGAFALRLLTYSDRQKWIDQVDVIERDLEKVAYFKAEHTKLAEIRKVIEEKRRSENQRVWRRFDDVKNSGRIDPDSADLARISHILDNGDALTANEYLDLVLRGELLPPTSSQAVTFTAFYPETYRRIHDYLRPVGRDHPDIKAQPMHMRHAAQDPDHQHAIGPVKLSGITGAQLSQAADLLECWWAAKRRQGNLSRNQTLGIMTGLGFSRVEYQQKNVRQSLWISMQTEPLNDRSRSPVAAYGSSAAGRYSILCLWGPQTVDAIITAAESTSNPAAGAPVMVFYFGCMTDQERRDLAHRCRELRRTLLVIDDVTILYLCGVGGSRLPVLFDCTLPFTFLEPYTTTASLVPPEMFYGRQSERDDIINPHGSCLIYGGRQLGKTALLRDVERIFHAPERDQIALWLDLKNKGIGIGNGNALPGTADEIWRLLATELRRLQVLPANSSPAPSEGEIKDHVEHWLKNHPGGRVLLLLDEADWFLEADASDEFRRVSSLKDLMDRTNRRFKVVFAGLHNVQRMTRLHNHPLAHYGHPICVGPLMEGNDLREARALVERPLASLGYGFESPDLVTRILSQTNYYPSLIQLYCQQLLRHLTAPDAGFSQRKTPPYVITAQHVEGAYRNKNLRNAIRDRFIWTLQLDQRYEVIVCCIAWELMQDEEMPLEQGFPVPWIRSQAEYWWADGFAGSVTEDAFRTLLEEMEGLGLLRRVDEDRFALRSFSVASLLGTREEIESRLEQPREVLKRYEPSTFRSPLPLSDDGDKNQWRSPLTLQQIYALQSNRQRSVWIIAGCEAAQLDELRPCLIQELGEEIVPIESDDLERFCQMVTDACKGNHTGGCLILVEHTCPWDQRWLDAAHEIVQGNASATVSDDGNGESPVLPVRVAFIADPGKAWTFVTGKGQASTLPPVSICLTPWHDAMVEHWLQSCGIEVVGEDGLRQVYHATGNWPALLRCLYNAYLSDRSNLQEYLDTSAARMVAAKNVGTNLRLMGLTQPECRETLRLMANYGDPLTRDDLIALADPDTSEIVIDNVLAWAEMLSLIQPAGRGAWRTDPIAQLLLKSQT